MHDLCTRHHTQEVSDGQSARGTRACVRACVPRPFHPPTARLHFLVRCEVKLPRFARVDHLPEEPVELVLKRARIAVLERIADVIAVVAAAAAVGRVAAVAAAATVAAAAAVRDLDGEREAVGVLGIAGQVDETRAATVARDHVRHVQTGERDVVATSTQKEREPSAPRDTHTRVWNGCLVRALLGEDVKDGVAHFLACACIEPTRRQCLQCPVAWW
jgi:hypothetical protein